MTMLKQMSSMDMMMKDDKMMMDDPHSMMKDDKMMMKESRGMSMISDAKMKQFKEKFAMVYSDLSEGDRKHLAMEAKSKFAENKMKYERQFEPLSLDKKQEITQKVQQLKNSDTMRQGQDSSVSILKQILAGVPVDDLQCKIGQLLVLKASTGTPICINEGTVEKLLERKAIILT